jgi:hypothetical protein
LCSYLRTYVSSSKKRHTWQGCICLRITDAVEMDRSCLYVYDILLDHVIHSNTRSEDSTLSLKDSYTSQAVAVPREISRPTMECDVADRDRHREIMAERRETTNRKYIFSLVLIGSMSSFYNFQVMNIFCSLGHKDRISVIKLSKITTEIRKKKISVLYVRYSYFKHSILFFSILQN